MPVAPTSLEAFDSVDLTERQAEVMAAIEQLGTCSDQAIAEHLDWTINRVTPRRGELVEYGMVVRADYATNAHGRRVSVWRSVRQPELPW